MDEAAIGIGPFIMLVLALDTSTRSGSIALARDGEVLEVRPGDPDRRHAERLPGDLLDLLAAHGCTLRDVDLLAACAGPGGFTGLRVGLATAQGLALGLDRRVYTASTLTLLALAGADAAPSAPWIGAWMRGMRQEIFTALYNRATLDDPSAHPTPLVGDAADMAEAWGDPGPGTIAVIGDGWPDLGAPLRARYGERLAALDTPLLAGVLARQASRHAAAAVSPAVVRPTYVRRPDAVVTREQETGRPAAGGDL